MLNVYNYLNTLPYDIELLYPTQFGNNLVLTPHTYLMNAAATLTDTVFLNAQGNADAVFVIQINGALSTSTYANVALINGTQAKNVFWKVEGAASINNYSVFKGTIICNNGALGAFNTGVMLDGRALLTTGALTTTAMTAVIPSSCATEGIQSLCNKYDKGVTIFPNPFTIHITIKMNNALQINNCEFKIYNVLGEEIMNTTITKQLTTLETSNLPSGIYFYTVTITKTYSNR